jgi:hypothetical protein
MFELFATVPSSMSLSAVSLAAIFLFWLVRR